MLNQKGQAFATFRLLISAIVAIAILTILFNILGLIQLPGQGNPDDKAAELITSQVHKPGSPKTTDSAVQFNRDDSISQTALANSSSAGLGFEQICVHPGDLKDLFEDQTILSGVLGKSIFYNSSNARSVKMTVLCDERAQFSPEVFGGVPFLEEEWANECGTVFDEGDIDSSTTVCGVFLRNA